MIYLDNNATTRPSGGIVAAVSRGLTDFWQNPSSVHRAGQVARHQIELARDKIAALVGCKPREVIFTSGGTESIDLAIRGVFGAIPRDSARRTLLTTRIEHAAVRDLAAELEKFRVASVSWIPVGAGGVVDVEALKSMIDASAALVSVQWANNETGAIQPVEEIARLCRDRGVQFHCDATQWIGKEPVPVGLRLPDLLSFAPHKFHGPKGVGVLISRQGVRLRPTILGTQELGRRGGTENVAAIIGAGVAADEALAWLASPGERARLAKVRDRFESIVTSRIPDAVINAPPHSERLWNTSNIGFPRLAAEPLLLLLSERGVCASAGAACSSGSLEPSPVLLAMGVPDQVAHGSLRFSLSRETTEQEVDQAANILVESVERLRASGL